MADASRPNRCVVVVLGDLGRSPRMLLQAASLAELGQVDLVGYAGTDLPATVNRHPAITTHRLPPEAPLDPRRGRRMWWSAAARLVRQTFRLSRLLLRLPRPDLVLVQNPPAFPTLLLAWIAARLWRARWVIDWHNTSYSMLALKVGSDHLAVRCARALEVFLGRRADAHLCVSSALRDALERRSRIAPAQVLHDRPSGALAAIDRSDAEETLRELFAELDVPFTDTVDASDRSARPSLVITTRPAVVVSPTSWTQDEDFPLLLDALDRSGRLIALERAAGEPVATVLVLLTGTGPLRDELEERLRSPRAPEIFVRTAWLAPERYPRILASADLGLCLHRSSSGLDLPMKLADMLGSGLPACVLDYGPVLAERFHAGEHGVLFSDADGLARALVELLRGFTSSDSPLAAMRRALRERPVERWQEGWDREARPLLETLLER